MQGCHLNCASEKHGTEDYNGAFIIEHIGIVRLPSLLWSKFEMCSLCIAVEFSAMCFSLEPHFCHNIYVICIL
jgi:hypothetical protein